MNMNICEVNWAYEDEQLLEPYEWHEEDEIEWLLNIPLLHVSSSLMQDCIEASVTFKTLQKGVYIICDNHYCLAISINQHHHLEKRSCIPYQMQSLIFHLVKCIDLYDDYYEIEDVQEPKEYGITRQEKEKKQLLLCYLDLFDQKEIEQLTSGQSNYIEHGYNLFHEYLYHQICKLNKKA